LISSTPESAAALEFEKRLPLAWWCGLWIANVVLHFLP